MRASGTRRGAGFGAGWGSRAESGSLPLCDHASPSSPMHAPATSAGGRGAAVPGCADRTTATDSSQRTAQDTTDHRGAEGAENRCLAPAEPEPEPLSPSAAGRRCPRNDRTRPGCRVNASPSLALDPYSTIPRRRDASLSPQPSIPREPSPAPATCTCTCTCGTCVPRGRPHVRAASRPAGRWVHSQRWLLSARQRVSASVSVRRTRACDGSAICDALGHGATGLWACGAAIDRRAR